MRKLYLVSTSGDYSKFGMGDSNSALSIPKKHYALIKRFLKVQLDWDTRVMMDKATTKSFDKYFELSEEVWNAGIFKNKYHCRTAWTLECEDSLYRHEPIKIDEE